MPAISISENMQAQRAASTSYSEADALAHWDQTPSERAENATGARLGKIARAREVAASIIDHAESMAVDGRSVPVGVINMRADRAGNPRDFAATDVPTTLAEARQIVAWQVESARKASAARPVRWPENHPRSGDGTTVSSARMGATTRRDATRLTDADVSRIAGRVARMVAAVARRQGARLTSGDAERRGGEYEELTATLQAAILSLGHIGTDARPHLTNANMAERADRIASATLGGASPRAALRAAMYATRHATAELPRWSALADATDARLQADQAAARIVPVGWAWLKARNLRTKASVSDEITDGQRLSDYARAVDAELSGASATADELLRLIRFTNAEQVALKCALTPTRVVELAERAGTTPNAYMVQSHRGRAKLAERYGIPAKLDESATDAERADHAYAMRDAERAMRAELRSVPALIRDRAERAAARATTDLMRADVTTYHAHKLAWPTVLLPLEAAPYESVDRNGKRTPATPGAPWVKWTNPPSVATIADATDHAAHDYANAHALMTDESDESESESD